MHDEVSETENIRKNLAIERMIVEGCEVLLDTSQTFVRQGKKNERSINLLTKTKLKARTHSTIYDPILLLLTTFGAC